MNPIDWVAFLYGRLFQNHPYVGGTLVTIVFGLFGLVLWLRGVDRYNSEHSKSPPASVTPAEQAKPDNEKKPQVKEQRMEKINKPPARAQVTQNAPGGINIGGDNLGTATVTNNYGPPQVKPLALEDSQVSLIVERLRPFSGQSVDIFLVGDRSQTQAFASKLRAALEAGGLNVTMSAAGVLIRGNGAPPPPGISVSVGQARLDTANALGTALRQQDIIEEPLAGIRSSKPDEFTIYLVPQK